ncbi:MAG: Stealth CR1 domain-containing protein [Lentisphaeria bacterium]|nr:Stealth CR1 domain-containing protein [Lentisphaeria bacterium]
MNTTYPIDFVIPWVDGNDPAWQAERAKYRNETGDSRSARFRDWGVLHYWFRGVEKFAPWVNKIHFITWGHVPEWLNTEHPKLHIVNHKDYIPEKYLPTFSSHPIELNMHRIDGLAEHFVYFNDDTFITRPVKETDFFRNGLPCDSAVMKPVSMKCFDDVIDLNNIIKAEQNNLLIINHIFDKKSVLKKYWRKFFSLKYGLALISSLLVLPYRDICGFHIHHLPSSFLKSTFEQVWKDNFYNLDRTSQNKMRFNTDVNQWLMSWYQICQGKFIPVSLKRGKCFHTGGHLREMVDAIVQQKYSMICCNDSSADSEFENDLNALQTAFNSILPEQSSFEKTVSMDSNGQ